MSKYIEVDAFVLKVVQCGGGADFISKVTGLMLDAPTIDIVHCRECKKRNTDACRMIHGKHMYCHVFDDDHCSYGERETDEL